ncbi:MAG TPA: hypothetical protein VMW16_13080 [Sedimentisphaerales bacterium]|nr:hypothetical protein [Sedimentisphaerales bacterium]
MKPSEHDKKFDELISRAISRQRPKLDFDKWQKDHQKQIQDFKAATEPVPESVRPPNIGRIIMKSRITKFAAAAAIIVAAAVLMHYVGSPIESVALADVLERIEQVQAFMYRTKMTMTGAMMPGMPKEMEGMVTTSEGMVTVSNKYGVKVETTTVLKLSQEDQKEMTQQMYILPDQKVWITVMPEQKKYTRMELDDDLLARMRKQNNDPREMIKQIMNRKYIELGRSVIDGVEVEGFETTDPNFMAGMSKDVKIRLWVDVENRLPVRAEMDLQPNEQMQIHYVIYDYQWNIPVAESDFEPVIPGDFTAFPTDGIKMPPRTEQAAVEGLKFFAEIFGQYPKKVDWINLMQEFGNRMQEFRKLKDSESPAGEQMPDKLRQKLNIKEGQSEEEKATQFATQFLDMMRPVQSLSMFYMLLVADKKDPAYYGESVGPDDADAVLMRWKISDDQYRVIYGDLTAENVNAEQLAQLESPPSQ